MLLFSGCGQEIQLHIIPSVYRCNFYSNDRLISFFDIQVSTLNEANVLADSISENKEYRCYELFGD